MSATTQTPPAEQVPEGQEWRGVAADGRDDLTAETTARLADRSRRLLKDLLTPYRSDVKLLVRRGAGRERRPPVDPATSWPWASTRASRRSSRTTTSGRCS